MPGDGAAVHVGEHPHHERHSGPNDRVLEAPADRHEKVPFKEQVIGKTISFDSYLLFLKVSFGRRREGDFVEIRS